MGTVSLSADLDRDDYNELIVATYPNLYVMRWDGTTLRPFWHRKMEETPTLLTAERNQNDFNEFYVNLEDGIYRFESIFATDPDSIDTLKPWNVEARPLTEKAVQVTWDAALTGTQVDAEPQEAVLQPSTLPTSQSFTVYRAQGEKEKAPPDRNFKKVAEDLRVTRYIDRRVTKDNTYWYTVTTQVNDDETPRTDAVAATPREPPQLMRAVYYRPEGETPALQVDSQIDIPAESLQKKVWVIVTFDRRMDLNVGDENRYILRVTKRIDGVTPASAIRDRMGMRALLVFDEDSLLAHFGQPLTAKADQYEITVSNVTDIDENPIRASTRPLEIPTSVVAAAVSDLTQVRVYPNPVRPNRADKGVVTFDRLPIGTRIQLFDARGALLETLNVTEQDYNRKEWWLTSNNTADVSSGIYIYVLEFDTLKKIGKIAVIR